MKKLLTALLAFAALTVALPSCVVALGNSGGPGCKHCAHCQGEEEWDSEWVHEEEDIEIDHVG